MSPSSSIDLTYLEQVCQGDANLCREMIGILIDELPRELLAMRDAAAREDWEAIGHANHQFQTSLAYLGNRRWIARCQEIQTIANRVRSSGQILALLEDMESELPSILKTLRDRLGDRDR